MTHGLSSGRTVARPRLNPLAIRPVLVVVAAKCALHLAVAGRVPIGLPVLPLRVADRLGVLAARSDDQDEVGWPQLAGDVERQANGADVVLARNYGEAGALELFGHGLPPVARCTLDGSLAQVWPQILALSDPP